MIWVDGEPCVELIQIVPLLTGLIYFENIIVILKTVGKIQQLLFHSCLPHHHHMLVLC